MYLALTLSNLRFHRLGKEAPLLESLYYNYCAQVEAENHKNVMTALSPTKKKDNTMVVVPTNGHFSHPPLYI